MSNKCKCIKDYAVSTRKYLGNGKHSDPYMQTLFYTGNEYYYFKRKEIYYVSENPKYLSDVSYYNTNVEELLENTFNQHFINVAIINPATDKIYDININLFNSPHEIHELISPEFIESPENLDDMDSPENLDDMDSPENLDDMGPQIYDPITIDSIIKYKKIQNRNEKCKCGSGRKYKNCCMETHQIYNNLLDVYNRLIDKLGRQDIFDPITENEKIQLRQVMKKLGMEQPDDYLENYYKKK